MPKDKQVDFEKAMSDIKKMILDTHEVKQVKRSYVYKGEDITHSSILACSFTIAESMKATHLRKDKEQGRDMLDVILAKVFQLGYSQAMIINSPDWDLLSRIDKELSKNKLTK